jgi:transketolase
VAAARLLQQKGRRVRVVSMPCTSVFDAQDASYRERVLPPQVERRVAIEAAAPDTWYRYVGPRGAIVAMHSFGGSGVAKDLFKHFGFTPENVVAVAERL